MELSEEEFIEKYADVVVSFESYYKYSFKYVGYTDPGVDGLRIEVSYGGDPQEIYRFELQAGHTVKLGETAMSFYRGIAETVSGEIIDEYYEF
jgi:hypothetical protein